MKGDAMRRGGELLMILRWIAAFVGTGCLGGGGRVLYGMAAIQAAFVGLC